MRTALALLLATAVLTAVAQTPPDAGPPRPATPAPALAELVERAWTIARRDAVEQARAVELDARAAASRTIFAGPPSLAFSLRRDLPPSIALPGTAVAPERGRNEIEPGLSAPLWLPGQRAAQHRVIERERVQLGSAGRALRSALAGEVREAAWSLALARTEARVQRAREDAARALEADVERRVGAGELAPVDRLGARAERLAATAAARDAEARAAAAVTRLHQLAGVDDIGELDETPQDAPTIDAHPALALAREAVDAARARLDATRVARRDNPTVSAVARFDRDTYGGDYRNAILLAVTVPFDTEARNAPRLAAAGAALTEAEVALERERRERVADLARARIALEAARAALDVGGERAAAARDAATALERAFRAGERGLPDVLRARAVALDATLAHELARAQWGLAIARLNQAQGITP